LKVALATYFPADPAAPRGGVEAVSVNLARALAEFDDLEVHVVTASEAFPAPTVREWGKVRLHYLPRLPGSVLGNAVGAGRRQLRRYLLEEGFDLVHAHDTYGLMVKGLSLPRVFTVHGFIHGDTALSGSRGAWIRSRLWKRLETAGWADQPHVISISPYVRERLSGIVRGVIHDIDNPVGEDFFRLPRRPVKGRIFSAALVSPRKNPSALVEAAALLRDWGVDASLRLAGSTPDAAYGERLRRRIDALGLSDRVSLLGRIPTRQVAEELSSAEVFSLVSLEENSPMGIEEAMAAGVPVVTSNRCGMPYMVRHGETGFLVDPHDPLDIALRLRAILEDGALGRSMAERSREVAGDRFHPAAVARRTREVYREAVRKAGIAR
jgi:glycosyltransferase involved in cell wall biosynthesis